MIFYFLGTGNSRWIAEKVAEINDKVYDISNMDEIPEISNEKQIGLVFPIYAWGVPEPMNLFAKRLKKRKHLHLQYVLVVQMLVMH